jgi:hypothetical protein
MRAVDGRSRWAQAMRGGDARGPPGPARSFTASASILVAHVRALGFELRGVPEGASHGAPTLRLGAKFRARLSVG